MSHDSCCNCCCRNRDECLSCRSLSARKTTWEPVEASPFQNVMMVILLVTFIGWGVSFFVYQSGDGFIYGLGALIVECVVYVVHGLRQAYK